MVIIDKWLVTMILAASLRFFSVGTQRNVLLGHIAGLMLYLILLASGPGELMETDARRSGGVGTFFMILTGIVGVI